MQVLVELTGQTANNRLAVMALQPAPVQLTWIGYPNSTGLKAVQYRLTGTHSPLEAHCISKLDSFWAYQQLVHQNSYESMKAAVWGLVGNASASAT